MASDFSYDRISESAHSDFDTFQLLLEEYIDKRWICPSYVRFLWKEALSTSNYFMIQQCVEFFKRNQEKIQQLPKLSENDSAPLLVDDLIKEATRTTFSTYMEHEDLAHITSVSETKNDVPLNKEKTTLEQVLGNLHSHDGQALDVPFEGIELQPFQFTQSLTNMHHLVNTWLTPDPENPAPIQSISTKPDTSSPPANSPTPSPPTPISNNNNSPQMNLEKKLAPISITGGTALEKMNCLVELGRGLVSADFATIFLHDPIQNELFAQTASPEPINICIPSHVGIAGACFTTGKAINCPYAYTDPRFYSGVDRRTKTPTLAILAVPIIQDNGKVAGVLQVLNKKRREEFTEHNQFELQVIARMIAKLVVEANKGTETPPRNRGVKRTHTGSGSDGSPQKKSRGRPKDAIWQNMKPVKSVNLNSRT